MHFRLHRKELPNHILKDMDTQFNYREGNDKLKELIKSTMKFNTFFKTLLTYKLPHKNISYPPVKYIFFYLQRTLNLDQYSILLPKTIIKCLQAAL